MDGAGKPTRRKTRSRPSAQPDRRLAEWIERLRNSEPVRARLGGTGRIAFDRAVPFLAVCRGPATARDTGIAEILAPVAALAVAPAEQQAEGKFVASVLGLARASIEDFGSALLLEVWADEGLDGGDGAPAFQVHVGRRRTEERIGNDLATRLAAVRSRDRAAHVEVHRSSRWAPSDGPRLIAEAGSKGLVHVGLAIKPVYRNPADQSLYPKVVRELRLQLNHALQRTFYEFSCSHTLACPLDYSMLGRRALVKAVWKVDQELAEVADSFDFLLQVSPTNSDEAWEAFKSRDGESNPLFRYRPAPVDPSVLRRRLFAAAVEKVEDPVLDELFRSKQSELALQIGLLDEIDTRRFVLGGMQLFGEIEAPLLETARALVARCPVGRGRDDTTGGAVGDDELAALVREEIGRYRDEWPEFGAQVAVRDDVARGFLVSQGSVLIGRGTRVPRRRVDALIQHEVGTHVLTYFNARAQPLRLLSSGLDGYEALQEGLAILAEYIVGGLSTARLRLLGARVICVRDMLAGAEFVDTFRLLVRELGFEERTAFNVATRVHRGGGLAKDAIYLRGLIQALEYVGEGGKVTPLALGKIAPEHIPLVHELQARGILRPPPLLPHYLRRPEAAERIARLRSGMTVLDLVDEAPF